MLKTLDIVLIAVMISAAAWTFKIKHEAELIDEAIASVERKASLERETIALLQADWSLLNQPDRLQRLAEAFHADLALEAIRPDQIVGIDELPQQPISLVADPTKALGGFADNAGSVVR